MKMKAHTRIDYNDFLSKNPRSTTICKRKTKIDFDAFARKSQSVLEHIVVTYGSKADYHLVPRSDLVNDTVNQEDCFDEVVLRSDKAKRCFSGKYDRRHMKFMKTLGSKLSISKKICLPLDLYNVVRV
jgi:hypothetical protein